MKREAFVKYFILLFYMQRPVEFLICCTTVEHLGSVVKNGLGLAVGVGGDTVVVNVFLYRSVFSPLVPYRKLLQVKNAVNIIGIVQNVRILSEIFCFF